MAKSRKKAGKKSRKAAAKRPARRARRAKAKSRPKKVSRPKASRRSKAAKQGPVEVALNAVVGTAHEAADLRSRLVGRESFED